MPTLESVLASIPGYGGYLAKKQFNEQQQAQDLQQVGSLVGIQQKMLEQQTTKDDLQRNEALRTAIAALPPEQRTRENVLPLVLQHTRNVKDIVPLLKGKAEGQFTLGDTRYDENGNPVAMNPKEKETKPLIEHNFSIGNDMVQPHISLDNGKTWKPIEGSKPSSKFAKQVKGDEPVAITDDTLEMDAWRYLTDGTLPTNMGRGVQGSSQATKIRNRSSELAKEMGMPADEIRFYQLTNKTQLAAIGQLGKARAQILQFEKTAEYNADLALNASKDVWRTDSPWLNRPLQYIRSEGLGDPSTKVFNAANETFVSEYARVMSGGYGAAQTTEGAQLRAHTLLSTASSQEQYEKVVKQLRAEMSNRVRALNTQMDEERQRLRTGIGRPSPTGQPQPQGTPTPATAPSGFQEGQTATGANGEKIIFQGGKWVQKP